MDIQSVLISTFSVPQIAPEWESQLLLRLDDIGAPSAPQPCEPNRQHAFLFAERQAGAIRAA